MDNVQAKITNYYKLTYIPFTALAIVPRWTVTGEVIECISAGSSIQARACHAFISFLFTVVTLVTTQLSVRQS
jgi:hypothetical protein